MISSKELADFDLGGSLSHLMGTEMDPENPPGTGTKSSKLDSKNAKSTESESTKTNESKSTKTNESKSTKTKSAKGEEPEPAKGKEPEPSSFPSEDPTSFPSEAPSSSSAPSESPSCFCRRLLREGELPVQEDVLHDRRLEIIKSMEPFGAKPVATFSQEYDLISKKSCDSLIQYMDTSLQRDIESGVVLPVASSSSGAEDAYESWTPFEEGGIDNQYNKKLCECVSCINEHSLYIVIYQTDVCILLFYFNHKTPTNLLR
jgi:hypothetical protein